MSLRVCVHGFELDEDLSPAVWACATCARGEKSELELERARRVAAELSRDTAYDTAAVLYALISRSSSRALKGAARRLFGRFIDMPSGRELREARHQRIAEERAEKRNQWRALSGQRDDLQRRIAEAVGALTGKAGYVDLARMRAEPVEVVQVRPHVFVIGEIDADRLREQVAAAAPVACATCRDTHVMEMGGLGVMCTRCPLPCERCRQDGKGPFCAKTPCGCGCHVKAHAEASHR